MFGLYCLTTGSGRRIWEGTLEDVPPASPVPARLARLAHCQRPAREKSGFRTCSTCTTCSSLNQSSHPVSPLSLVPFRGGERRRKPGIQLGTWRRTWRPGGKTDWGPRRTCMHICSSITIFVSFPSRFCCIASHLSGTQKHAVVVIVDAPLNQTQELVPFSSISSHTPAVHTVIIYNKDERKGRRRTRCLAPVDGIFQGARASAAPFA
jgi:hypothetical protein